MFVTKNKLVFRKDFIVMIEYLKIETPFNRDNDGTKKMIDGDFRNEAVEFIKDIYYIIRY